MIELFIEPMTRLREDSFLSPHRGTMNTFLTLGGVLVVLLDVSSLLGVAAGASLAIAGLLRYARDTYTYPDSKARVRLSLLVCLLLGFGALSGYQHVASADRFAKWNCALAEISVLEVGARPDQSSTESIDES